MSTEFEPKIMGFLCNWCAYAGADTAGSPGFSTLPTSASCAPCAPAG